MVGMGNQGEGDEIKHVAKLKGSFLGHPNMSIVKCSQFNAQFSMKEIDENKFLRIHPCFGDPERELHEPCTHRASFRVLFVPQIHNA